MINVTSIIRKLWRKTPKFAHLGIGSTVNEPEILRGEEYISIGDRSWFCHYCSISAVDRYDFGTSHQVFKQKKMLITLGDNCHVGPWNNFSAINGIHIGNGFLSGRWVTLMDNNHGLCNSYEDLETDPAERGLYSKGPIIIGKNVWLGDKVTVLGGVTIGDGCVVGANSVVTHDLPSHSICVGAPAKAIRIFTPNNPLE